MRLFVGKNHKGDRPIQSIFRLAGNDEDALTYALGFLLAHDPALCCKLVRSLLVRSLGVGRLKPSFKNDYSVRLQEVTDSRFGRRDIVIEAPGVRIVLEAKIGGAVPAAEQLLKYAIEDGLWDQFETRAVVALTKVALPSETTEKIRLQLAEQGVSFAVLQWHEVLDLVMRHEPADGSEISRYLFDQFVQYIRKDYEMSYYDAEISIQDIDSENAKIYEDGWMCVSHVRGKKAPLYFAPYFTKQTADSGLKYISRVLDIEECVLAGKESISALGSVEHRKRWSTRLELLKERAIKEGFSDFNVRVLYLDKPIQFRNTALTKTAFNAMVTDKQIPSRKQIPNQIPRGFSLQFDELLFARQSGHSLGGTC